MKKISAALLLAVLLSFCSCTQREKAGKRTFGYNMNASYRSAARYDAAVNNRGGFPDMIFFR